MKAGKRKDKQHDLYVSMGNLRHLPCGINARRTALMMMSAQDDQSRDPRHQSPLYSTLASFSFRWSRLACREPVRGAQSPAEAGTLILASLDEKKQASNRYQHVISIIEATQVIQPEACNQEVRRLLPLKKSTAARQDSPLSQRFLLSVPESHSGSKS